MNTAIEPSQGKENKCRECPYEGVKKVCLLCRGESPEGYAETAGLGYKFSGDGEDPSEPIS